MSPLSSIVSQYLNCFLHFLLAIVFCFGLAITSIFTRNISCDLRLVLTCPHGRCAQLVVHMVVIFCCVDCRLTFPMAADASILTDRICDTESSSVSVVHYFGYPYCLGGYIPFKMNREPKRIRPCEASSPQVCVAMPYEF